jgi:hypothetical protein
MDEPREIRIVLDEGFADVDLPMVSCQRDAGGAQEISAAGLHRDGRVGFQVRLEATWERQDLESAAIDALYWGRAELVSVGSESDGFLRLLDELYGTGLSPEKMRPRIPFLAVSLEGNPVDLERMPIRMKLFFESDLEERAAEFYVNVDVQARSVQFHEKDTDYRRGVVLSLSEAA